jgi:hypothetical protein
VNCVYCDHDPCLETPNCRGLSTVEEIEAAAIKKIAQWYLDERLIPPSHDEMRREWDEGEFTCVFEVDIAKAKEAELEERVAEDRRADEHFAAQQQAEEYHWSPADEAEAILSEPTPPDIARGEPEVNEPPPHDNGGADEEPPHDTGEADEKTTEEKLDAAQVAHGPAEPWNNGMRWMLKHCFFNAWHTKDVFVARDAVGGNSYSCPHASCQGRSWDNFVAAARQEFKEAGLRQTRLKAEADYDRASEKAMEIGDYLKNTPAEIAFIVDGLIYQGSAHLLMGTVKAGKTVFSMAWIKAVLRCDRFIGKKTTKTSILYITEQSRVTFQRQLLDAGFLKLTSDLFSLDGQHSLYIMDPIDYGMLDWTARASLIRAVAAVRNVGVVIIDTFPRIALVQEVGSPGEAIERFEKIAPVQIEDGRALVLGWHERKAGGNILEAASGTVAFAGAVDFLLRLQRAKGEKFTSTLRLIEVTGRATTGFEEAQAIDFNTTTFEYKPLGSAPKAKRRTVGQKVCAILPEEAPGLTLVEILEGLTTECEEQGDEVPKKGTVRNALDELVSAGLVEQTGAGFNKNRNEPFRYHRVEAFM